MRLIPFQRHLLWENRLSVDLLQVSTRLVYRFTPSTSDGKTVLQTVVQE